MTQLKTETVKEYLARGGKIQKIKPTTSGFWAYTKKNKARSTIAYLLGKGKKDVSN